MQGLLKRGGPAYQATRQAVRTGLAMIVTSWIPGPKTLAG